MSFDFFVGPLKCIRCETVSPEDTSTNMQTKIQASPKGAYLHVGDTLDIRKDGVEAGGYLVVNRPQDLSNISILELWECPSCDSPFNWAEIVVKDSIIKSITAAPLDRDTLSRVNYISDELDYVFESLTGKSLYVDNEVRPDYVRLLSEKYT